jgi:ribosome-binding factor A
VQGSRPVRLGEQIRQDLSVILTSEVKDPGIGFLTLTHVKVSADLQVARVYYTTLGDARARRDAARALARAAPFLRRQLAGRLRLRRAPELHFQYDESIARGERVEQLLQEIHAAEPEPDPSEPSAAGPGRRSDPSGSEP